MVSQQAIWDGLWTTCQRLISRWRGVWEQTTERLDDDAPVFSWTRFHITTAPNTSTTCPQKKSDNNACKLLYEIGLQMLRQFYPHSAQHHHYDCYL
jgi:hypothetical protein